MSSAERSLAREVGRSPRTGSAARTITPMFPLLLLETMRDKDRPGEILEDEDISISMPRRLGLSEVVRVQIQRFQTEVRQRRPQSAPEVEDLVRLVVRRPDADEIFQEAGEKIALHFWEQRSRTSKKFLRFMPGPLARLTAQRAAKRMFRQLTGGSRVSVSRWPIELKIARSLTARADPGGSACSFYAGAFVELLRYYTGREYRPLHPECEARGSDLCRWGVEVKTL